MLLVHLIQGSVGNGVAAEFIGFLNLFHLLPAIDEILLTPTGVPLPSDPSVGTDRNSHGTRPPYHR
jgi:hypothetical protein